MARTDWLTGAWECFACSFSASVARLFELGVPTQQWVTAEPWILKNTDEKN